jgi:hypothetical protein
MALTNQMELLIDRERAGVLHVPAVDAEHQRPHAPLRLRDDFDPPIGFEIDAGRLLALAQVGDGLFAQAGGDAVGYAAAGAAPIETEDEARTFRGAAMHERIDAERAVQADQLGRLALEVFEARPPDQRALTEHPEVFAGGHQVRLAEAVILRDVRVTVRARRRNDRRHPKRPLRLSKSRKPELS